MSFVLTELDFFASNGVGIDVASTWEARGADADRHPFVGSRGSAPPIDLKGK
jgi:hypothetical protein